VDRVRAIVRYQGNVDTVVAQCASIGCFFDMRGRLLDTSIILWLLELQV
jgi:hypothetical protein